MPLEKIGLVARQADQRDARVGYAVLTAAGQQLLDHASATAHAVGRELLQDDRQSMGSAVRRPGQIRAG